MNAERLTADFQDAVEAIVAGDHGDPFAVLGPHRMADGLSIRVFNPRARKASVIERSCGSEYEMRPVHAAGFFVAEGLAIEPSGYRLRFDMSWGSVESEDPYRFGPILQDMDVYLIAEGTHERLYEKLGAHPVEHEGIRGVGFAVWAPNARRVSVVGDFNGWDGRIHPMRKRVECGVWELFVPGLETGALYKFEIKAADGRLLPLKADPFAFFLERRPSTASIIHGLPDIGWQDTGWLQERGARNARTAPISIYEVHLGSWMRGGQHGEDYLSYEALADKLIAYAGDMGFTHIELLPVSEHPFDGSWGYQPLGLYAPTSRFGSPNDFARLVNRCHAAGIGVFIDWVPGHFPSDPHGLGLFDGTHLYEHADPRLGFHVDWNTLIYNYGRREVRNFLEANALFWLDRYHIDGLRVDAVASMLYLDYSRREGEWVPNIYGGRENLEAIDFLRRTNILVYRYFPETATMAEESTAWPGVSRPVHDGGLGFGYKWNMGWMHDTLQYISRDPLYRGHHHDEMTFGLLYAFSENFVLPLSHDEVVHGKGSLLGKMPGDRWQRFANLRAYLGFMFGHPGKKLLFMGGEFAQEREWNHDRSLDWHLLGDPAHQGVQALVRDLNGAYRRFPALHEQDCEAAGFQWVIGDDKANSVFAFLRYAKEHKDVALVVSNFTPVPRTAYQIGVPREGFWREIINTDSGLYGGSNLGNIGGVAAEPVPQHGQPASISLTLPPLATVILAHEKP